MHRVYRQVARLVCTDCVAWIALLADCFASQRADAREGGQGKTWNVASAMTTWIARVGVNHPIAEKVL